MMRYKIGKWYVRTFPLTEQRSMAMATTVDWPESPFDLLAHDAYFASGKSPDIACARLEQKLEILSCAR